MVLPDGVAPNIPEPAPLAGDRELKFAVPAGRAGAVTGWLGAVCRPDRTYPSAVVSTIYYDTPGLPSLAEKVNSDFLKVKIRLRWYAEPGRSTTGQAFVEAKVREGTRRAKVRVPFGASAEAVAGWSLDDSRLGAVPRLLRARGIAVSGDWQPVLRVRYRRDRFIELSTRTRVNFDTGILADPVNRRFVPAGDPTPLPASVLEAKGSGSDLPSPLRPLVRFGARRQSFSKYLAVYRQVTRTTF